MRNHLGRPHIAVLAEQGFLHFRRDGRPIAGFALAVGAGVGFGEGGLAATAEARVFLGFHAFSFGWLESYPLPRVFVGGNFTPAGGIFGNLRKKYFSDIIRFVAVAVVGFRSRGSNPALLV